MAADLGGFGAFAELLALSYSLLALKARRILHRVRAEYEKSVRQRGVIVWGWVGGGYAFVPRRSP